MRPRSTAAGAGERRLPAKRAAIKQGLCDVLWRAGGASAFRSLFNLLHPGAVRILSGHRVVDEKGAMPEGDRRDLERGCLSRAQFIDRIDSLRARYGFLSLLDCAVLLRKGLPVPAHALILTFDDGFRDLYDSVLPALADRQIPFTIFLTTGWLGKPGMLTAQQAGEMAERGRTLISWGAHGVTHRPLTGMHLSEAEREIAASREQTEEIVGSPVRLFCYPDGKYNADVRRILASRGFEGACATGRRINVGAVDRYALQRIPFENEPPARFAFRVAGWV